jgi:hypothetical protein
MYDQMSSSQALEKRNGPAMNAPASKNLSIIDIFFLKHKAIFTNFTTQKTYFAPDTQNSFISFQRYFSSNLPN